MTSAAAVVDAAAAALDQKEKKRKEKEKKGRSCHRPSTTHFEHRRTLLKYQCSHFASRERDEETVAYSCRYACFANCRDLAWAWDMR